MSTKYVLPLFIIITIFLGADTASAHDNKKGQVRLTTSESILAGGTPSSPLSVTLRGQARGYDQIAFNTSPEVFQSNGDSVTPAMGTVNLAMGRLDKDGSITLVVDLPSTATGKWYLQGVVSDDPFTATGKDKRGRSAKISDDDLSAVVSVISLKEILLTLNIGGSPGETGPMGPEGPMGPQGLKGEKGDKGDQGERGEKGDQGDTGPQGSKGDKGDTGAQGPIGLPGPIGPDGPAGAAGPMGPQGPAGVAGPVGPQGATGPTGPQGERGERGEKGDIGPVGPAGPAGPQGEVGPVGPPAELSCPSGWIDLGPTCIQPVFTQTGTIENAINNCYAQGAKICEHQDLAYVCSNRDALGVSFPDDTWFLTGSVIVRALNSNTSYVGYTVYRKAGSRCFGPATVNPTDGVLSYDLSNAVRNYACCADKRIE